MIDIGVNLTNTVFDADRDAVLARAEDAGVQTLIVIGTDLAHSQAAVELAAAHPGMLYATAGVHPHDAAGWESGTGQALMVLAEARQVVAIGECGLDFNRNYSPPAAQEYAFEAQLELAAALGLPVFLHQRDALPRFLAILGRYRDRLSAAVAHCFTEGPEALAACLDLDLHIGVTGWITDARRGEALRQSIARAPLGRLMIETDAPYLLPRGVRPLRARRNEPMYLSHVCAAVAQVMGRSPEEVAAATTRNARAFFRLP